MTFENFWQAVLGLHGIASLMYAGTDADDQWRVLEAYDAVGSLTDGRESIAER
jgi:hypothetical protein